MRLLVLADIADMITGRSGGRRERNEPLLPGGYCTGKIDAVIACGDVDDAVIRTAAAETGATSILAVKGNHDRPEPFPAPVRDLHLAWVEVQGVKFGGFNGAWQYKSRGHFLYTQQVATQLLVDFPPVDVFVAHNSPRHIHDKEDDLHAGFEVFNYYIARSKPRLLLHGHQHMSRVSLRGMTTVVGVFGHMIVEI